MKSVLRAAFSIFLFCSTIATGQPDTLSTRVLFEPAPIPQSEADALPLVSFNNSSNESPALASGEAPLTLAQRREIEASIQDYVEAVGDEESEQGPFSSYLQEDLMSAGLLAQRLQDHDSALDFFTRAQYVSRINEGLDNPGQVSIMKAMVESHIAMGQTSAADRIQENILYLGQQTHGERGIGIIPDMLDYGIWHMNAFLERSNILLNVERMNVAQFMDDPMNFIGNDNNLKNTPLYNLYQAQQTFLQSIDTLIRNKEFNHPRIIELERMLLKSYFLSIHRENILYEPDFYLTRKKTKTGSRLNTNAIELLESEEYKMGNDSHQRIMAYITNNPDRTASIMAQAMLEAADWHLLFERKVKASRDYQAVYDFFRQYPDMETEVSDLLYPAYPTILPTYLPPPNSREKLDIGTNEAVNYFGYFDVSFRIDKFGKAKKIRILGQGGEVSRNLEIRLNQYLQNILFRPLFRDGKPFTDTISLRYYLAI